MAGGYSVGSEASWKRLEEAVQWALQRKALEELQLSLGDTGDIPTVVVKITNDVPDEEGMYDAKFVVRDISVVPHTWRDIAENAVCKVDIGLIDNCAGSGSGSSGVSLSGSGSGPGLLQKNCVYQGFVTEYKNNLPVVLVLGSGTGGDLINVAELIDSGVTPPGGYLDARLRIWIVATNTLLIGPFIWLKDITRGPA